MSRKVSMVSNAGQYWYLMRPSWLFFIFLFSGLLSRIPVKGGGFQRVMLGARKGLKRFQGMQDCLAGMVQAAQEGP